MSEQKGLLAEFAGSFALSEQQMKSTLIRTVFPGNQQVSDEQFVQFIAVAKQYGLNPFVKEIYAFPAKGGGIQPIVSIDGWLTMINRHPQMDGLETLDSVKDGKLESVTAKIYIKGRGHPVSVTEYMIECRRDTDTWKKWPARMLRHKAVIQCARYAFGFSGIMEEDEYERMQSVEKDITPAAEVIRSAEVDEWSPENLARIKAPDESTADRAKLDTALPYILDGLMIDDETKVIEGLEGLNQAEQIAIQKKLNSEQKKACREIWQKYVNGDGKNG